MSKGASIARRIILVHPPGRSGDSPVGGDRLRRLIGRHDPDIGQGLLPGLSLENQVVAPLLPGLSSGLTALEV